jgi:hypothetical protein
MPLFDENGQRIRGKENQEAAETALAKVKVANDSDSVGTIGREWWPVAKVCSEYLQYCERGVANNTISKGQAWHWKQTDCWYYTPPGTKRRVPLFDADGRRIRGKQNDKAADLALARMKAVGKWRLAAEPSPDGEWTVAQVCSGYVQYCGQGLKNGTLSQGHRDGTVRYLNLLCEYCGALPVSQIKKGHVKS